MSLLRVKQSSSSWIANKTFSQILFIVIFLETLAVVLAIWGAIAAGYSPKAFFEEGGYITILSCLQLFGSAVLARKIFWLTKNSPRLLLKQQSSFWQIASWGLFFLTLDDALQIHESIDRLLHRLLAFWFGFQETAISDLADDAVVGIYLLLAIYIVSRWRSMKIFQRSLIYFQLGCILASIMVVFDAASNNLLFISMLTNNSERQLLLQVWMGIFEDSLKIYAGGLFFLGIYKSWRIAEAIAERPQTDLQSEVLLFSYKKDN